MTSRTKHSKKKNNKVLVFLLLIAILSIGIFLAKETRTEKIGATQAETERQMQNNNEDNSNDIESNNTPENNTRMTTETNLNEVREAIVTRVEEKERIVSKSFWDWWVALNLGITPISANINVEEPNLRVEKTVITETGNSNLVYAGDELTYEISITNEGNRLVQNIEVIDNIPNNTTLVSINKGNEIKEAETIIDENNNVEGIKWIVAVEPGETAKVSFTVRVF